MPALKHPLAKLLSRLAIPALLAIVVLEAPPLYGAITADFRLSAPLKEQLKDGSYAYSVVVELGFQPEYFHIRRMQQIGTVAGVEGRRIRVLQLTAQQVREIAGFYWVKRLRSLEET